MKTRTILLTGTALAVGLAFGAAGANAQTRTVKFGMNETLSGQFVAVGLPVAAATRMAVKEINDAGGFKVGDVTYKIELIEEDNKSNTASAVAGMTKLVEDDKVKFIFGPTLSALANQVQQITTAANVIEFSAATSWQSLGYLSGTAKPTLFGTQMPATRTAAIDVSGFKEFGAKKVAFISTDDDTTKGSFPSFQQVAKENGMEVVSILFPAGTTDYSAYVTRAKSEGVDGIYYLYPQSSAPDVMRYVVDLGAAPKGFGGRGLDPEFALSKAIGKPIPIPFFTTGNTPSFAYPPNAKVKAYVERLTKFEPKVASATANFSFFAYDFVPMLVEAIKKAGTVDDTLKIAKTLSELSYDGVAGRICFGKDIRTADVDGGLIIVRDGKLESKGVSSTCK